MCMVLICQPEKESRIQVLNYVNGNKKFKYVTLHNIFVNWYEINRKIYCKDILKETESQNTNIELNNESNDKRLSRSNWIYID